MEPKIGTLAIENFRTFKSFKVEGLKRVNLITGRNNVGKTSLLEAIRIWASKGSIGDFQQILESREELVSKDAVTITETEARNLLGLINGFPNTFSSNKRILITVNERIPDALLLDIIWSEAQDAPGIMVNRGELHHLITLDFLKNSKIFMKSEPEMPCIYVSPYNGERTAVLGSLWDKIALSDPEKNVIECLQMIDPEIFAVSMVGGESPTRTRTAIVRTRSLSRPVLLRSFGDGMNRLFGIILSLVNAADGILLIDEFENGLHHTVQTDIWRVIFKLAQKLDIQVFATTHSWDAIEAFQKAASESPGEDGALIRLLRKGEEIIPTVLTEKELAIATRDRIEVR